MKKFIAVAPNISSSYQLLSLLSYIRANTNEIEQTYALVAPYWHANQIPKRYLTLCERRNVILTTDVKFLPDIEKARELGYKLLRFYVNNVSLKSVLSRKQDRAVLIADGLGTYGSYESKVNAVTRERGVPTISEKRRMFTYMLLSKIAECLPSVYSYMIFDKAFLKLDNTFIQQFKTCMSELADSQNNEFVNYSIFISQPLVQLGILTKDRYVALLKSLERRAIENEHLFMVKPHPAEDVQWYLDNNLSVLNFDGVIEEFAVNNPQNEFVSFLSSALLTLPNLTESNVYRLPLPEFEQNIVLSSAQKELLNRVQALYLENLND